MTRFTVSLTSLRKIHRVLLLLPIKPGLSSRRLPRLSRFSTTSTPCLFCPNTSRGRDGAVTSAFFAGHDGLFLLEAFHFGVSLTPLPLFSFSFSLFCCYLKRLMEKLSFKRSKTERNENWNLFVYVGSKLRKNVALVRKTDIIMIRPTAVAGL